MCEGPELPFCGSAYKDPHTLELHKKVCKGIYCRYDGCGLVCGSEEDLADHVDSAHAEKPDKRCELCGYGPREAAWVLAHLNSKVHV